MTDKLKTKCSFVSIIGQTNAGKSTLLNKILDKKISIVSHKVQTTRFNVKGIKVVDDTQLVFIDTPGNFKPRNRLGKAMISSIGSAIADADTVVLLVDCTKVEKEKYKEPLIEKLKRYEDKTILLALNKVDLIKKDKLLAITAKLNAEMNFQKTFMISAETGVGIEDLTNELLNLSEESPWFYDADQTTDMNVKLFSSEMTREKIYKYLHQELPYEINVATDSFKELDNKIEIHQTIYLKNKSQKLIVIGKNGQSLKRIGTEARDDLRRYFRKRVQLFLFVKVKENWQDTKEFYDDQGLNFNS